TEIVCFADGVVTATGESSSFGKYCTVEHGGGFTTLYAHCERVTATAGAAVRMGDKLGEVGATGQATGPHLHFALQREGIYLNPVYYLAG
ncbi:MAG: M23 family metallopeptidase, partial [Oscillibacter sp.]|nr:M23 family metallopeptidase [Oscillibacter sp.]